MLLCKVSLALGQCVNTCFFPGGVMRRLLPWTGLNRRRVLKPHTYFPIIDAIIGQGEHLAPRSRAIKVSRKIRARKEHKLICCRGLLSPHAPLATSVIPTFQTGLPAIAFDKDSKVAKSPHFKLRR